MERIVSLRPFEIRIARFEGQKAYNREFNKDGNAKGCKPGSQRYIDGFCAELAFCNLMNLYPRVLFGDQDEKADAVLGQFDIDVKCTDLKDGRLMVMEKFINRPCFAYVLMFGTLVRSEIFEYVGFAFKSELFRPENLKDFGKPSKAFVLAQQSLRPYFPDQSWKKE